MDFLSPDHMNRTELIRIIVCQFALVSAVALFAAFFGLNAGLSAAVGGLCVAVPNTLVVVNLLVCNALKKPLPPMVILVAEFLKILVTCALFVLAAKLCAGLNWPAMLSGIIAAAGSMFLLPLFKR